MPGRILRVLDAVYRFLASLKLAVISLGTLAAVLAYATFFESWYGTAAVQEWIYRSKGFALLLAFLGANILCAALIRFPWKKRQTGFVITHAGLLILLVGSWRSVQTADEGQVGMLEGETKGQLVRVDYPVVRVRKLDPHTQEPVRPEYAIDFRPGNFPWGPGHPRPRGIFESLLEVVTLGFLGGDEGKGELLADTPAEPFKLVARSFLPASVPAILHVPDPKGVPMAKIRPLFKGPGMPEAMDVFSGDQRWFVTDRKFYRSAKSTGPAQFAFMYVDRPELVEDFLAPPKDPGQDGVARFRYRDRSGKERSFDWRLDDQLDKALTLPDSDLVVTFQGKEEMPLEGFGLEKTLGDASLPLAHFKIRRGGGEEVLHMACATLPMFPNVIPSRDGKAQSPLAAISYYLPPALESRAGGPQGSGRFGVVEVLGTPSGSLYYRAFGRGEHGRGEIRSAGPVAKGKEVRAFGGNPNQPMTIAFEVEEYFAGGREKEICEPIVMPKGKQGEGIGAALVAMTVDGHTEEFWIRRSPTLDPVFQRVSFPSGDYEVSFDVDRKELGFNISLDDFEVGFDPGTRQASRYVSQIRLNDEPLGIRDRPVTIQMNEPMTHRGYTFFQSNYSPDIDPRTLRETGSGKFQSVFQVATDPGRSTKYAGCLLVVFGAFVQFYMRAGLFGYRRRAAVAEGPDGQGPGSSVAIVNESEETL